MRLNIITLLFVLATTACTSGPQAKPMGVANPASVNCVELGGTLEIRKDDKGNEYALCHLPDGTVCEEWALFRKQCPRK